MIKIDSVSEGGELGSFRANAESLGWRRADGGRMVVHQTNSVKRAEWREGCLRILCQDEEGHEVMFGVDGIDTARFDDLWRFFEQTCGVYIKKHKLVAELSAQDFDGAMRGIEAAADKVDESAVGSVNKKAREADLMKRVEGVRDGMDQVVSGDKQALSRVFAENGCERIGRLRLVVDTVNLEVYQKDPRWVHLSNLAATVESVLRELGKFHVWKPPEDGGDSSMQRRQMVRELGQRTGSSVCGEEELAGAPPAPDPLSSSAPRKLKSEDFPTPPLGGLLSSSSSAAAAPAYTPPVVKEAPAPVPEPAAPAEEAATPSEAGPGEDWDVEVDNPNQTSAGAPDQKRSGAKADGSRIRYIYSNSVLEGWVWKRSQYLKKWRRRWLVLQPDYLATYKQRSNAGQTEKVEKGSVVQVYSADAEVCQTKAFCVTAAQKRTLGLRTTKLFMVCDTEQQRDEWMKKINDTLGTSK
eukprot:CAMPEP_0203927108 /NCGR_PEP_ID=MMETSP0359-20131031/66563_1 /ASSEMBLY_ACC=CAM_ASM_000338 /TAXON_ID=268821 /ORGANISM="Scrippsiella Hangoei, Strain SHTV-5" /LENGTH=467 /DNA_ID=CAMNT_0050855819 /DNA_START=117 /DNA_END=1520 /DNA_ORIENTATION=+